MRKKLTWNFLIEYDIQLNFWKTIMNNLEWTFCEQTHTRLRTAEEQISGIDTILVLLINIHMQPWTHLFISKKKRCILLSLTNASSITLLHLFFFFPSFYNIRTFAIIDRQRELCNWISLSLWYNSKIKQERVEERI